MPYILRAALVIALGLLAGCGDQNDLSKPVAPLGDFRLGYAIVVADKAETVGPSRKATPDEIEAALKTAIRARLGRYQGDKLYHIGVGVPAYALAVPGVPVVLSPKSVLVIEVDVWDDTAQRTINPTSKRFTVFEGMSGSTVIGSGLTKTREQQLQTLSENAARVINDWLVENKAWFSPEAVAARAAMAAAMPVTPAIAKPTAPPSN